MSDFEQAVKWMKEGKRVKRSCWAGNCGFIFFRSDGLLIDGLNEVNRFFEKNKDFEADDWEVWEDKKTLSDEGSYPTYDKKRWYREDKVKKSIKDLREKSKERRDVNCKPMVGLRELREFERGYNMAYNHFDILIHRVFGLELTEREDGKCEYCDGNGCVKCSALHALDGNER